MKYKVLLLLCFLLLVSCGVQEAEPTAETPKPTEAIFEQVKVPQSGKTLNLSMRFPKNLNPLLNEDITVDRILKLMFEPLVIIDENQKAMPNLLDSFAFSEDGKSVTAKLKSGLKWYDGQAIRAEDIAFSIGVIKNAEASIYKPLVQKIVSYNVVDDLTITIAFAQSFGGNSYDLSFPIIPKHYYEGNLEAKEPMGDGVYKFEEFVNSREIKLSKNTNYYKSVALIDFVRVVVTADTETDMSAFDQGVIDVITSDIADWGKYHGNKEIGGTDFITNYYDLIGFNFNKPALQDIHIRKAIAYLIPKESIVNTIYLEYAVATDTPINPHSWLYEAGTAQYYFDMESSKKSIVDGGFVLDENQQYSKDVDGKKVPLNFRILVNTENKERVKIAEILKTNLAMVGIPSEIVSVPFEEFQQKLKDQDFDLFLGGYNLSQVPDLSFLFHSSNVGGSNPFSYKNETMDMKLNRVQMATNEIEYKDALSDLQYYITDDLPCVSLVFRKSALLTDRNIQGDLKPTVNNIFNNIHEWFIFEEES